jgi:sensor histidine kinase YesM
MEILIVALTGAVAYLTIRLRQSRRKIKTLSNENSTLHSTASYLESERLKFQIQPHTINNMLAGMGVMARRLNKGIDALAGTLEYVIYKGEGNLVSIQDELEFVKKYLDLNDTFTNSIDSIKVDHSGLDRLSKYYTSPAIPHLATACLIENAFKHGDNTHPDFLRIRYVLNNEAFEFYVSNRVNANTQVKTGGVGLVNLKKRLDLLTPSRYDLFCERQGDRHLSGLIIRFNNAEGKSSHT